jgi:hypothetical protein
MSQFQLLQQFIQELIETPYLWWREGDVVSSAPPFYAENNPIIPTNIKNSGCNCAGFLNLICRFNKTKIPGVEEKLLMAGGTYIWFSYLNERNLLEPFNPSIKYPDGTIVLRDYVDPEDQGHIALIIDNGKLAHCDIANGIHIDESVLISHNWINDGYYTHVCLPNSFLLNKTFSMN